MKVHNFAGFMKTRGKVNESEEMEVPDMSGSAPMDYSAGYYSANPEEGEEEMPEEEPVEGEEGEEEEEVTLEDLKAMIEDLTERIEKLEGDGEEEEEEPAEGEEEEPAEGEEEPAK